MVAKINAWGRGRRRCAGCADVAMESTIHRLLPNVGIPYNRQNTLCLALDGFTLLLSVTSHFPRATADPQEQTFYKSFTPHWALLCVYLCTI
jgi:hypothetical protein